jgi:hypothetical protein
MGRETQCTVTAHYEHMRPVAMAKLFVPTHPPFLVSSPVAFKFFNVLVLNIAEKMLAGR